MTPTIARIILSTSSATAIILKMVSSTPLGRTAWVSGETLSSRWRLGRQVGHALRPDQHRRQRFNRHSPGDFIHPPVARQREENGPVVCAVGRPEDTHHGEWILGHLFTLVEAITDLKSRRTGRLGAEQSLIGRGVRRIVGKQ